MKIENRVIFDEPTHTYTDVVDDCDYISVTTLIAKYYEPFDSDYWATYKAVKDELLKVGEWHKYKKQAGGWMNVVDIFRFKGAGNFTGIIEKRKQWYLDKWAQESEDGKRIGTEIHKKKEENVLSKKIITINNTEYKCINGNRDDVAKMSKYDNGLFAELLIYNSEYKLAGQADAVKKKGKDIWIYDYKTNKKISDEPFMEKKFLHPLEELYETTKNEYMLQLSTYGWMIEQYGYNIKGLYLYHIDRKTTKIKETIKLDYRPDLVAKMLNHYKDNYYE